MRRLTGGEAPAKGKGSGGKGSREGTADTSGAPGTADTALGQSRSGTTVGGGDDAKKPPMMRRASSGGYDKNLGKSSRSVGVASSVGTSSGPRPKLSDVHEHSQVCRAIPRNPAQFCAILRNSAQFCAPLPTPLVRLSRPQVRLP